MKPLKTITGLIAKKLSTAKIQKVPSVYFFHKNTNQYIKLADAYIFGRNIGNTTFPDDRAVSKKHCQFFLQDGKSFLQDCGSANGTKINKIKIEKEKKIPLQENDEVRIGQQTFIFKFSKVKDQALVSVEDHNKKLAPKEKELEEKNDSAVKNAKEEQVKVPESINVRPFESLSASQIDYEFYDTNSKKNVALFDGQVFGRIEGDVNFSNDRKISKKHLRIILEDRRIYIVDLNSSNGIKVNGEKIYRNRKRRIHLDDEIEFGNQSFILTKISNKSEYTNLFSRFHLSPNMIEDLISDRVFLVFCAAILVFSLWNLIAIPLFLLGFVFVAALGYLSLATQINDRIKIPIAITMLVCWFYAGSWLSTSLMCRYGGVRLCASVVLTLKGEKAAKIATKEKCKSQDSKLCRKLGIDKPKQK